MSDAMITEAALSALRADVAKELGDYRMAHTLGVEEMAAELAALYCPEKTPLLRAAALLHDVTKELTEAEQQAILDANGVTLRPDEAATPQIWHAVTAALVIPQRYAAFALPELVSAVRWHATGRVGMTLTEAIIYLADVIERGRRFADCIALREQFFGADPVAMSMAERRRHLRNVLLLSYDKTVAKLQARGQSICLDTLYARDDLKNRSEI